MTIAVHRRSPLGRTLALSLAVGLLATTTAALATEGQIFAIQVTPASVPVNEPVTMKLLVGGYKVKLDCAASWSVRNSSNVEVAGGQKDLIADSMDQANYSDVFKIDKPGVYSVVGQKGIAKPGQQVCESAATTTLTVTAKVSSQPLEVKPSSTTPTNRGNPIPKISPVSGNPGNPGAVRKP
nr:hypothetical protein [Rhodoferax sp.]